jgi:HlyD family secretion protein
VLSSDAGAVAPGTPLLELGDSRRLEIVVDVLTADAAEIHAGAPVELGAWGGAPLAGIVRLVEPSARTRVSALGVEEQRVAVIVDLVAPPAAWRDLGDGWRVEARITTWSGADVVQVPMGALVRDGDGWAVYVVSGRRARLRRIEIGHRGTSDAEVRAGLSPGDRVVYHPGERVADGVSVAAP